jgi:ribosomal protein S18 acetylase RimI-like enzyme
LSPYYAFKLIDYKIFDEAISPLSKLDELRIDMIKVRLATVNDVEQLSDCEIAIFESLRGMLLDSFVDAEIRNLRRPESVQRMRNWIQDPNGLILKAEDDDGKTIGVALGTVRKDGVTHLGFLGVIPNHRRRGFGSKLLRQFIAEAGKRAAHKVFLFTAPSLHPAIQLYVKEGFVPEGFLKNHYHHQDFIIYSKFIHSK